MEEILENKLKQVIIENPIPENSIETPLNQVKRKRGRPSKEEEQLKKQEEIKEAEKQLENLPLDSLVSIGVSRLPNPIPLTDFEKESINKIGNKVLAKYVGTFKYLEEAELLLIIFAVIYPRLFVEKKENDKTEIKNTTVNE